MKKLLAGMLLPGSLFLSLAAAANGISLLSCWYPWDYDTDVRQWNDNEWVWAGVRGQVEICDGEFQRILTNTVRHTAYWKGVNVDPSRDVIRRAYPEYAVTQIHYRRINGDEGYATAYIPNFYR